ncbi:MAG: hypothetical protein KAT96_01675 [Candidatus Omnitrophica bacterium]|nr:hypothetical protein [Candidatus Omnitrophota bacterium]
MVSERKPAPEKQLLNLIERPEPSNIQQTAIKRAGFSLFSWGTLKGRYSFFKKNIEVFLSFKREPLDIKRINEVLYFSVFILAVYFTTSFTISALNLEKRSTLNLKIKVAKQGAILTASSSLKKLSYYLEKARVRDIFNPLLTVKESGETTGEKRRPALKITEAARNLKLVGISWRDDPDVLIKDTKLNKVYILKKGEMIGKVKIETVFKDKVVLSYEGEELTLR